MNQKIFLKLCIVIIFWVMSLTNCINFEESEFDPNSDLSFVRNFIVSTNNNRSEDQNDLILEPRITLFSTVTAYNGALVINGGLPDQIDSTNLLCENDYYSTQLEDLLNCSAVAAVISLRNTLDPIKQVSALSLDLNFDPDLPVVGPTGILISNSWSNMLNGGLDDFLVNSLDEAHVGTGTYWSFSNHLGNTDIYDCEDGNSTSGYDSDSELGNLGSFASRNSEWLSNGTNQCSNLHHVLCICSPSN